MTLAVKRPSLPACGTVRASQNAGHAPLLSAHSRQPLMPTGDDAGVMDAQAW